MSATVLITRPLEDSLRLADALRSARIGSDTIVAPVTDIVFRDAEPLDFTPDIVLLTSRHAVPSARHFADLPVLCVGDATAHAASVAGLRATSVNGTANELVDAAISSGARAPLHLRGAHTRGDVLARLRTAGLNAQEAVVYDQVEAEWTPQMWRAIEGATDLIVPLFSPRNARLVAKRLSGDEMRNLSVSLVSMSAATDEQWEWPEPRRRTVAGHPDLPSMIVAIGSQVR